MRLDAWLKLPHPPAERLRLIERLAQALNAVHDRGETLASIAPERVEVGSDLKIDLSPAKRGRPEPGYAAPERLEGAEPSTAADIYSIGSLCWEALVGRPCGEAPKPLGEIAPELSRELANSVMGCLERSPEWRPKDLTYLAQLAAAQQKAIRGPEPAPVERVASPPRASATPRAAPRRASRSHLPLLLAAGLLIAAAAASYLWLHRQQPEPSVAAGTTPTAAEPTPSPLAATPDPAAPSPSPSPRRQPSPRPRRSRHPRPRLRSRARRARLLTSPRHSPPFRRCP
jgi:serine/threonine-protein kinase